MPRTHCFHLLLLYVCWAFEHNFTDMYSSFATTTTTFESSEECMILLFCPRSNFTGQKSPLPQNVLKRQHSRLAETCVPKLLGISCLLSSSSWSYSRTRTIVFLWCQARSINQERVCEIQGKNLNHVPQTLCEVPPSRLSGWWAATVIGSSSLVLILWQTQQFLDPLHVPPGIVACRAHIQISNQLLC